jgi:glutaconate CoA-transferase, subunit B
VSDDYRPVLRPGSDPVVFFRQQGGDAGAPAKGHIMVAVMARALRDGELVIVGANPLLPLSAARLAQLMHAPNLNVVAGASGGVNPMLEPLAPSSGDYANLVAEAALTFPEVLMAHMGGRADVFFAGGLQIDRRGNCNLAGVMGGERVTLRGPGSAGIPWAAAARRTFLYTTSHTSRVFVPAVDFVSLAGHPVDNNAVERAPSLVVTPLAVLDFAPDGNMWLSSIHPGITLEQVRDNTGFDLNLRDGDVPVTQAPTEAELAHMRSFDLDGLLAIVA